MVAWLLLPFLGALLAVPSGESLWGLFAQAPSFNLWMTLLFGCLWGVGRLTFGLSLRYLGVALGQSLALGTCAALGTIMGPVLLNAFFPELNALGSLTTAVIAGVAITLVGIAIIGVAGGMKAKALTDEEKKAAVKEYFDQKVAGETQRYEERAVKAATKAKEKYIKDAKNGQKDS